MPTLPPAAHSSSGTSSPLPADASYHQRRSRPMQVQSSANDSDSSQIGNPFRGSTQKPETRAQEPEGPKEIFIAIMGATGSGKSEFVNLVSGSDLPVGNGLKSCTATVEASKSFRLDGLPITLVDSPGFDDTNISDTDVLKMIAVYLATTYKSGQKLCGVIYMHRISDVRMGGVDLRNFRMFRKLCGDESLKNVAIVTNMWGEVDEERGAAREYELQTHEALFKPVFDNGAHMFRHTRTVESAHAILRHLLKNSPQALRIQSELIDEGKDITQTAAGEELDKDLADLAKKHAKELAEIRQEMEEAIVQNDMELKKELEEEQRKLEEDIKKIEEDRGRLLREYEEVRVKAEAKMSELEAVLASEKRLREESRGTIDRLIKQMEEDRHASDSQRAAWRSEIEERQRQLELQRNDGFFTKVGRWIDSLFGGR